MLGTLVVLYLFLGGCGAGVMFVTAAWSLAFHRTRTRTQEQTAAFGDLKARCYGIGFVMLCLAALCLLLDLGRPELAFLLFTRPTLSILSFGSFTLLASILVSGFLAVANLMYVPFVHSGARKAAEAACLAVSLCMMVYTGMYVGWIEAVALWNNAATPALFALSSLSAGISTVFVIAPFVRDVTRLSGWMLLLHRVHLAVLVLELVMLAGFVAFGFSNPFAHESLAILFDPSGLARGSWWGWWAWACWCPWPSKRSSRRRSGWCARCRWTCCASRAGWCCDSALFGRGCIEDARLPPLDKLVILYNAERMIPQKE